MTGYTLKTEVRGEKSPGSELVGTGRRYGVGVSVVANFVHLLVTPQALRALPRKGRLGSLKPGTRAGGRKGGSGLSEEVAVSFDGEDKGGTGEDNRSGLYIHLVGRRRLMLAGLVVALAGAVWCGPPAACAPAETILPRSCT